MTGRPAAAAFVHAVRHVNSGLYRMDFKSLPLPSSVSLAFKRAFETEFAHYAPYSQLQAWYAVRKFSKAVDEMQLVAAGRLPEDVLLHFVDWLNRTNNTGSSKQKHLNLVISVVAWCSRNVPSVVAANTRFDLPLFEQERTKTTDPASQDLVKRVLKACHEDIERIEEKLNVGLRIALEGGKNELEVEIREFLLDIVTRELETCRAEEWTNWAMAYKRRLKSCGGVVGLKEYAYLTPKTVFPFYLAILIQSGGNPSAIRTITRDCIHPHPLRTDVEYLVWEKKRSRQEQVVDVPVGKAWSATSLARRVMNLNADLAHSERTHHRNKVFLCVTSRGIALPCHAEFHILLQDFVARHNLEHFQFKQFRRAIAVAHHSVNKDIEDARSRLNHKSPQQTSEYLDNSLTKEQYAREISYYQGLLESEARQWGREVSLQSNRDVGRMETIFGFSCVDPFSGVAPGSIRGQLCDQFHGCASCPGAVVTVDDLQTVARILSAQRHLLSERDRSRTEGWSARFEALYGPTLSAIEADILPAVSKGVLEKAGALSTPTLPALE